MKNILIRTVILNICVLSLSVSDSVWAVEVGPSATVTGTTPEIRLVDTTTGDASWEIEAQAATSAGANFLEISLDGSTNGSGIFKIHRNADPDNFTIDENGNIAINGDAAQVFNELEVFGNVASDTFTAIAVTPDSSSNLSARIRVSNSQNEFGINTRGPSGGYLTPFTIDLGAPSDSLTISAFGDIGIGTSVPTAPLHVRRSDGSAKILVEETATPSARTLFQLKNPGDTSFGVLNTQSGVEWVFTNSDTGLQFSREGSGDVEMEVLNNGNLVVAGGLSIASDVNSKTAFTDIDSQEILNKVAELPVTKWEYKDALGEEHIGPMAQDFHAAFGLGATDTRISTIDADGIALAAIKALIEQNRSLAHQNQSLAHRVGELEKQNKRIEELLITMVSERSEKVVLN